MTIEVRSGKQEDIEDAVEVVKAFSDEFFAETGMPFDSSIALNQFKLYEDYSVVAYDGDKMVGLLAGCVVPLDTTDDKMFQEKVWYVLPEYRVGVGPKLLRAIEERCIEEKIKYCVMAHLGEKKSDIMKRFYDRQGYRVLETHYLKEMIY